MEPIDLELQVDATVRRVCIVGQLHKISGEIEKELAWFFLEILGNAAIISVPT